jgi:hypothetical protein
MSRVIKMSTPQGKPTSLPKTAASHVTPDQPIAFARGQWSAVYSSQERFSPQF